jgi:hypothetical protein
MLKIRCIRRRVQRLYLNAFGSLPQQILWASALALFGRQLLPVADFFAICHLNSGVFVSGMNYAALLGLIVGLFLTAKLTIIAI